MPLTAVGRIFKPELRRREAEDALETALGDAGVSFRTLNITHDRSRGMFAVLELESGASPDLAREVLGRFALFFEIR